METKGQIVAVVSDANEKGEASMPTTSKVRNTIGVGASSGGKVSAGAVNVKFENINVHGALYVQGSHTDHGVGGKTTPQEYVTATVKDYESFESRDKNMTEVMEALKDPNISVIGVHGMPGVGKTMLVRKIMERARAERLFSEMVMVTVTQNPDHRNIQSQIADRMGLEFTEGSLEGRADKLHDRLYGKEILLVLDDIWDELNLEKVGIPSTGHQSELKVLITSRYGHVLSKMNADKIVAMELLTDDESWRFFTKIVGEAMTKAPYMERIGRDIVKECARLPIALAIVAKMLKNKEEAIWRVSLDALTNPAEDELQEVNKKVYHPIKVSYGILQKEAQDLFLLCSVFPEDYDIHMEELFMYGKGMGLPLSKGTKGTLARGRYAVAKLVDDLKSACLLLESDRDGRLVKMHDVVRDVAISIASKEKGRHLLSYGHGLKAWPARDTCGSYTAVFMDCGNYEPVLPKKLKLPNLEILLLRGSYLEIEVSDTFLEDMKVLKVLHLENMHISSPFSSLTNLQTLGLQNCRLEDVSIVGELKNLEILSFKGSDIKELSSVLSQLTQLKMLDLTNCSQLKVILPNLISSLSNLEELYMENSFVGWEGEGINRQRKNASLSELIGLPLTALYICIPDANIVPEYLFSRELNKYRIVIGSEWFESKSTYGAQRALEVKANSTIISEDGVMLLVQKSEELLLTKIVASENILSVLGCNTSLKKLYIEDCEVAVNSVIAPSSSQERLRPLFDEKVILLSLETLEIMNTNKFDILLSKWQLPNTFSMLCKIKIVACNNLKRVFPSNMWSVIQNLEVLVIEQCELLEEIFAPFGAEEKASDIIFTKLKGLVLVDLPKLKKVLSKEDGLEATIIHFVFPELTRLHLRMLPCLEALCAGIHTSEWPSLEELVMDSCGKLISFASEILRVVSSGKDYLDIQSDLPLFLMKKVVFPILRYLSVGSRIIIKDLEHGCFPKEWFPKLTTLILEVASDDYNPITTLPSTIFENIPNLTTLHLDSCKWHDIKLGNLPGLKIFYVNLHAQNINFTDLPKIVSLYLKKSNWQNMHVGNLRELKSLDLENCQWENMDVVNLPELKRLDLENCQWENMDVVNLPEIKSLDLKNCQWENMDVVNLPELKSLDLENCQWKNMDVANLPELKSLDLENCQWENMHIVNLPDLKRLDLENCQRQNMDVANLPELRSLGLENCRWENMHVVNLPELKSLDLKNCQWENMHVVNLRDLKRLDLENCQWQNMDVANLPELKSLDWENCQWKNLYVANLPELKRLDLENCQWKNMDVNLPELKSNDLENCQRQNMNVANLPELKSLGLEDCQWENMHVGNLPELKSLDLKNCQWENMDVANLPELKSLDWENCQWKNLYVANLPELKSLGLENCQYQNMHVANLPELKRLDLENCRGKNMDVVNLPELKSLNLENCQYENIDVADFLRLDSEERVMQSLPEDHSDLGEDETGELARCERVQAKRRQKWIWDSVAAALTLGTAALAWSYSSRLRQLVQKNKNF